MRISDWSSDVCSSYLDREDAAKTARESHRRWLTERGLEPVAPIGAEDYADHIQPMVLLTINTGLRRGEMFKLRRADIDTEKQQVKVRAAAAKSGKARQVPLNTEAFEAVTRWIDRKSVGWGQSVVGRVDRDGGRKHKK